jgi:glycosyltransferase involved in cell wall biosynthesis
MENTPLVSVCIPSYNRPDELLRLLSSIDATPKDIEIVICEDKSPKRDEIKVVVDNFIKASDYDVKLFLNENNFGYDKNIRELVKRASGKFIVYMGDDDVFVPRALDKLIEFLEQHLELGYVLKSHRFYHADGKVEPFKYYPSTQLFEAGFDTYISLFRKSVFISGFTINREFASQHLVTEFDGTLLMQLYLLAEVVLEHPAAYFDEPLTQANEGGTPFFGSSDSEKDLYTPGTITVENSLNFLRGFFKITQALDNKYDLASTELVKKDMSKYFYPSLAIQRNGGIKRYFGYVKQLRKIGFGGFYFNLYVFALVVFGKKICDSVIVMLKKILGRTPEL